MSIETKIMKAVLEYVANDHNDGKSLTGATAQDYQERARLGLWLARVLSEPEWQPGSPHFPSFGSKIKFPTKNIVQFEETVPIESNLMAPLKETQLELEKLRDAAERILRVFDSVAGRSGPRDLKSCGHFASERTPGCWNCGTSSAQTNLKFTVERAKKVLDKFRWIR
jgi:hypothetical protein